MWVLIGVIAISLLLLLEIALRPSVTHVRSGKILAFAAIVVAPAMAGFSGLHEHMERTKTVAFCTSCHVMERHGRSLHIDELGHIPAMHYQYNRVPRETACFACHTDYTLYGDYNAKLRGLRHVWVQYFGKVPDKIKLYSPYNNRECLHCHEGARSFLESATHKSEPGRFDEIRANRLSCMAKGCHDTTHDVESLDKLPAWPPVESDQKPEAKK
jgi:cytochrome c-type protein NapC